MARAARLIHLLIAAGAGCSTASATIAPPPATSAAPANGAPTVSLSQHCQMAIAALDAVVKRWDEQALALDRACVERVAAAHGRINADARFTIADQLQILTEPECADPGGRFLVRLGPRSSAPSASAEVVLLTMWSDVPAAWDFNAVVDVATWPTRRPGATGLPICGAAFGILRRPADSWVATLVPPPRSRAQLELGR